MSFIDFFKCEHCEYLKLLLEQERLERTRLLDKLLDFVSPEVEQVKQEEAKVVQPINTSRFVPIRVRQQMLEAEDREQARLMKKKQEEIADLEKELGVNDAS